MVNAEMLSQKGEDIVDKLGERAKRTIEDATSTIKSQSEDAWADLVAIMRKHPGKTLGIAVATGVAFGVSLTAISRGRRTANANIRELAGSGAEAWDRVKTGLDDAVCNLKDAFEDAVGKFK